MGGKKKAQATEGLNSIWRKTPDMQRAAHKVLSLSLLRHKVGGVSAIYSQNVKHGRAFRKSNPRPSFYK